MPETIMNSMQRVLTTLEHREPDRVPLFLLLTMHGAKELGLSIKEYFSKAEYVVEGQQRLLRKYHHDCIYTFFYAPVEVEAWGGEVVYVDNGPPNSGSPIIKNHSDIRSLYPPSVYDSPCLMKVLHATQQLKQLAGNETPIIGVVMSPFSLPVMQLGFSAYLDLLYEYPDLFNSLMAINEEFCVNWANAQLAAGATAICYFDPVSSPTIIPRDLYLRTGFLIAQRVLARIHGPAAIHFASGRSLPILDDVAQTGAMAIGCSALEDLSDLKSRCCQKMTVIGNLNGLEMINWNNAETVNEIKSALIKGGPGGGFILADNHGEIPWAVPDDVLMTISETVRSYGQYPIHR